MQPYPNLFTSGVLWRIPAFATTDDRRKHADRKQSSPKSQESATERTRNRVLLFSGMWELVLYRAEVLRTHGFQVITPRTKEDAVHAIKCGELDVAVLTYTLPNEIVHELADLLREHCPECRLIAISDSGKVDRKIAPDATVLANQGPAGLIQALRRLQRRQ